MGCFESAGGKELIGSPSVNRPFVAPALAGQTLDQFERLAIGNVPPTKAGTPNLAVQRFKDRGQDQMEQEASHKNRHQFAV